MCSRLTHKLALWRRGTFANDNTDAYRLDLHTTNLYGLYLHDSPFFRCFRVSKFILCALYMANVLVVVKLFCHGDGNETDILTWTLIIENRSHNLRT